MLPVLQRLNLFATPVLVECIHPRACVCAPVCVCSWKGPSCAHLVHFPAARFTCAHLMPSVTFVTFDSVKLRSGFNHTPTAMHQLLLSAFARHSPQLVAQAARSAGTFSLFKLIGMNKCNRRLKMSLACECNCCCCNVFLFFVISPICGFSFLLLHFAIDNVLHPFNGI